MKYWYDTEFIEDGSTIDLISIGIVAEDGRELYLQSVEYDPAKASDWVRENVLDHLVDCDTFSDASQGVDWAYHATLHGQCTAGRMGHAKCPWRSRNQIKTEIRAFMDVEAYGKPELWGYYSAYDHVAFCQLFGTMMDLPKGFPMYTRDIKQLYDSLGNPRLPEQGKNEHNALADARWNRQAYEFLQDYAQNWEGIREIER